MFSYVTGMFSSTAQIGHPKPDIPTTTHNLPEERQGEISMQTPSVPLAQYVIDTTYCNGTGSANVDTSKSEESATISAAVIVPTAQESTPASLKGEKRDIILLLDRSGSMEEYRSQIIRTVNKFIEEERKNNEDSTLTLIAFNHVMDTKMVNVPVKEVKLLTKDEYQVHGKTALYDAIDLAMNVYKRDNVRCVIVTDGFNNHGTIKLKNVRKTIEERKKQGWRFIYLANDPTLLEQGENLTLGGGDTCSSSSAVDFDTISATTSISAMLNTFNSR